MKNCMLTMVLVTSLVKLLLRRVGQLAAEQQVAGLEEVAIYRELLDR